MKYRWVILLLLAHHLSLSQSRQIDSLKKVLLISKDTARIDCLNALGSAYFINALNEIYDYVQTDTARLFALEAYEQALLLNYKMGMAEALQNLGEIERDRGNFIAAENYLRRASSLFENMHKVKEMSWSYLTLGWSLFCQCKFSEAKVCYKKSMPYYLDTKNKEKQSMLYRMISYTYSSQGYNEKAFEYVLEANRITQKINDFRGSVSSPQNLGLLYREAGQLETALGYYRVSAQNAKAKNQPVRFNKTMGYICDYTNKFDSAIYYFKQAFYFVELRTRDTLIRKKERMERNGRIGEIFMKQKNYDMAIAIFREPMLFYEKGNDRVRLMKVLLDIGNAYQAQKKVAVSFLYTNQLAVIARASNARPFIRDSYELYWKLYDQQGKMDSAYKYYLKYIAIKDSILKDEYLRNIPLSEMKTADEQQKTKIDLLQKDQQIKQQQLMYQQQTMKGESFIRNILIVSIILILAIVIFIYRNISLKRKNEKLQSERKHSQLQQQATELEMLALRSQMNPHFIFNCLSSINRFILINNTEAASSYLTKFSRLIRMALQHSEKSMITLEKELEMLRHYLDLERLRFKNAFDYSITFINTIDTATIFVPPLILQPFAENAIWHGLMHKKGGGHLDIALSVEGKILTSTITDNGIGRSKAALLNSKTAEKDKSMGMKITVEDWLC
ncbi:MAG: histidine kinase [Bacteroidota bacterium]|nr:histidine kinase [Bacteroidota bacterium]